MSGCRVCAAAGFRPKQTFCCNRPDPWPGLRFGLKVNIMQAVAGLGLGVGLGLGLALGLGLGLAGGRVLSLEFRL